MPQPPRKRAAKPNAADQSQATPKPRAKKRAARTGAGRPKDAVDLTPNALVTDIASALATRGVDQLQSAAQAVENITQAAADGSGATALSALASEFHKQSQLPGLVTFTGFLGGVVKEPGGAEWLVLFVDWELSRWVVVPSVAIVGRREIVDDTDASGKRDVIWLKADALVGTGSGSQAIEARFLTGEFTRAGDIATPGAGATAAATGVFCEARSVGCCLFRTRR